MHDVYHGSYTDSENRIQNAAIVLISPLTFPRQVFKQEQCALSHGYSVQKLVDYQLKIIRASEDEIGELERNIYSIVIEIARKRFLEMIMNPVNLKDVKTYTLDQIVDDSGRGNFNNHMANNLRAL